VISRATVRASWSRAAQPLFEGELTAQDQLARHDGDGHGE